jgi:hypothetical protein
VKRALFLAFTALSLALVAQLGYSAGSQSQIIEIQRYLQKQNEQLLALQADLTALAEQSSSRISLAAQDPAPLSPETPHFLSTRDSSPPPCERSSTAAAIPEAISMASENFAARMEASRLIEAAVSAGQWTESDASQLHQLFRNTTAGDRRALIKKLAVAINNGTLKVLVKGRMY